MYTVYLTQYTSHTLYLRWSRGSVKGIKKSANKLVQNRCSFSKCWT